jgi:hypothetical protein
MEQFSMVLEPTLGGMMCCLAVAGVVLVGVFLAWQIVDERHGANLPEARRYSRNDGRARDEHAGADRDAYDLARARADGTRAASTDRQNRRLNDNGPRRDEWDLFSLVNMAKEKDNDS